MPGKQAEGAAMRFILWLGLALGLMWGGYWFAGSYAIEKAARGWFQDQQASGLVAENSGLAVTGFADRFDLTVTAPHLADPASGWGWQAPFAQVFAMTWKPWHLIAALPNDQSVTLPDGQKVDVASSSLRASLLMRPAMDLPPHRFILDGEGLALASDAGWTAKADKLVLAAEANGAALHLGADGANLAPPEALAALPDLGPLLSTLHLDATVTFATPVTWDMNAARAQDVTLSEAHVVWGKLDLTAKGSVRPDAGGLAEGKIDMALKGWRSLPAVVVALGLVKPEAQPTVLRALEFLAASSPDPEVLSLPLTFRKGEMALGPLPLGPAPRLQ